MYTRMLAVAVLSFLSSEFFAEAGPQGEEASAKGTLDKALIRQVVRQHLGEVQQCYKAQLQTNKDLAGRLTVRFTIDPGGKVVESRIEATSLGSPACEKCIADAVRGWEFPRPSGGKVVVSYPFVLAPSEPGDPSGTGKK